MPNDPDQFARCKVLLRYRLTTFPQTVHDLAHAHDMQGISKTDIFYALRQLCHEGKAEHTQKGYIWAGK